jgi:CrcB protein
MLNFLIVFLGGGLGSISRYLVSLGLSFQNLTGYHPKGLATISVNIIGCFLIAIADGLLKKYNLSISPQLRLLFITGFLGGFTTYSSLVLDLFNYTDNHGLAVALSYLVASIFLGWLTFFIGIYVVKTI